MKCGYCRLIIEAVGSSKPTATRGAWWTHIIVHLWIMYANDYANAIEWYVWLLVMCWQHQVLILESDMRVCFCMHFMIIIDKFQDDNCRTIVPAQGQIRGGLGDNPLCHFCSPPSKSAHWLQCGPRQSVLDRPCSCGVMLARAADNFWT